jgi:hypothetical protein
VKTHVKPALAALAVFLVSPWPAAAQMSGEGFMFWVPTWRLAISTGFAKPRAQSDIFDFVTDELTLGRGDFAGAHFGGSLAVRVKPRLEVSLGVTYAGRTAESESRDFEGEDDLPVLQSTTLDRVPIMLSARVSLVSQGRAIGRYAWIPRKVVPYVGAGAGAAWYRLRQEGEFVDRETLDIFEDAFESSGWAPAATAFGGTDVSLNPRYGLTVEGRYLLGKAPMNKDFSTYNKIDLSGYDASIGLYFRF